MPIQIPPIPAEMKNKDFFNKSVSNKNTKWWTKSVTDAKK